MSSGPWAFLLFASMPATPRRPFSLRINKSDRNVAFRVARIMPCGRYQEVRVKSLPCHGVRALIDSRAQLVKVKRDLGNQGYGLLKNHGPIVGKAGGWVLRRRAEELLGGRRLLQEAICPLLAVHETVSREIAGLFPPLPAPARNHEASRRAMTVPGVASITAPANRSAIDDPTRLRRPRSVGADFGLTPRRHASGEIA